MTPQEATIFCAVAAVVTFLVCAVPSGYLIAKRGAHVDVRRTGSGNIGTTNVARSVGKGAAALTLLCDAGKGALCVVAARLVCAGAFLSGDASALAPSGPLGWVMGTLFLAAVLGHVFSPYLGFHGGKGIAVGFGTMLAIAPAVGLGLLVVFAAVVAPTRYVSAASVSAAASLPVWCVVLYHASWAFLVPVVAACLVVVWAHRSNLAKLARGEERRFAFHRKGDDDGGGAR